MQIGRIVGDGTAVGKVGGRWRSAANARMRQSACACDVEGMSDEMLRAFDFRPGPTLAAPWRLENFHERGLRDVMVHSSVCKAPPKDIDWRLAIGFEFQTWRDPRRHLYFVIRLRLCLLDWQPVTLDRAIDDLLSNDGGRTGTRLETCRRVRRNDLVHRH